MQKTVAAFEDSERSRESLGREQRRVNAILRRQAGMDSLGPRAVGQELHGSRGHASRDPDGGESLSIVRPSSFADVIAAPNTPQVAVI